MSRLSSLWAAAMAGLLSLFVLPAAAWAAENDLAAKKPKGLGIFGGLGAICCLVFVGAIVLVVVLVMRNRKR